MTDFRVLIVDDDPSWRKQLQAVIDRLNTAGLPESRVSPERYQVEVADNFSMADRLLDQKHFHLAVIDLELNKGDTKLQGKELVQKIAKLEEGTSIVVVTAHADASYTREALKTWQAFDLFVKGEHSLADFGNLAKAAVFQARDRYRDRFESAVDFLRGDQEILPWMAEILNATQATGSFPVRADQKLRGFLNKLLGELFPLLHYKEERSTMRDFRTGVLSARCWSKAVGQPLVVRFGPQEVIAEELGGESVHPPLLVQAGFAQIYRSLNDVDLGLAGVVYAPAYPEFGDFERRVPR
jgi:CheY-like chemotaxis protein